MYKEQSDNQRNLKTKNVILALNKRHLKQKKPPQNC